jgi:tRNA(fMet)-specific endonuclease VapC
VGLIVDTSVFIEAERRSLALATIAHLAAPGETLAVAAITIAELLLGVHLGQPSYRRAEREAFVGKVIEEFQVLPFDVEVAAMYSDRWAALRRMGSIIPPHDLLIGATALYHGFDVLTHNVRDFDRIPGLTVRTPAW